MPKKNSPSKKDKPEDKDGVPSAPPIFDVSKPGKTAASPTSKPVIVGHGAMVKNDPMVSSPDDEAEAENQKEEKVEVRHKREATIKPINLTSQEKNEDAQATAPEENQETEDDKNDYTEEDKPDEKKPKDDSDQPEASTSGAIDALAGEASAKRQSQKQKEEEEKKKQATQELIKSGKYHLPIHDAVYRRTNAFALFINLLLVILLLLAGVVLAQDAGYIDIGLVLPFDLIK
jgi:hypothetical protein